MFCAEFEFSDTLSLDPCGGLSTLDAVDFIHLFKDSILEKKLPNSLLAHFSKLWGGILRT